MVSTTIVQEQRGLNVFKTLIKFSFTQMRKAKFGKIFIPNWSLLFDKYELRMLGLILSNRY